MLQVSLFWLDKSEIKATHAPCELAKAKIGQKMGIEEHFYFGKALVAKNT